MHYIYKELSPDFFESEKSQQSFKDDPAWNNLHCKTKLRFHLINEQNQLCIYCERQIDENNTHNLDNLRLNNERFNARSALQTVLKQTTNIKHRKSKLSWLLSKKDRAFTSFLNNYFKPVL